MPTLSILTEPNPLLHPFDKTQGFADKSPLRQKCQKVKIFDDNLKKFAADMLETMREKYGVGLAAPQVGKTIRLIVIEFDPERLKSEDTAGEGSRASKETPAIPLMILVNPKIISQSKEKEIQEEGCLSMPGIEVPIERAKKVKVLAQDLEGNRLKIRAKDYFARILQHEIDHLNGILITDKGKKIKKLKQ